MVDEMENRVKTERKRCERIERERARGRARSKRRRLVRSRSIQVRRLSQSEREHMRQLEPDDGARRLPLTRGECAEIPRPCGFVSCRYHLYLDVSVRTGAIKFNFPDLEVWEMADSCALDIAERGGETLEAVGAAMNLTRERVRQLELRAMRSIFRTQAWVCEYYAFSYELVAPGRMRPDVEPEFGEAEDDDE